MEVELEDIPVHSLVPEALQSVSSGAPVSGLRCSLSSIQTTERVVGARCPMSPSR